MVVALGVLAATIWIATYCTQPVPGFHAVRSTDVFIAVVLGVVAGLLRRTPEDEVS